MPNAAHSLLGYLIDGVVAEALRRADGEALTAERLREVLVEAVDEVLAPVAPRLERLAQLAEIGVRAATVGHELRNPLSVIETSLFLLGERSADPRTARLLHRISEQVSISTAIINELLDGARDRVEPRVAVDLAEIAESALDAVPRPGLIAVERTLPRGVGFVLGEARRLRQVVVNLLSNAVRATRERESGALISLALQWDEQRVTLTVRDNGSGIDDPAKLFELLHTTHAEGLGIGLALSRRIAVDHNGQLTGGNRDSGGAWFTLELPRFCARDGAQT